MGFSDIPLRQAPRPIGGDFDAAMPFSEGLAAVRVGDSWGYIDFTGAMKITPRFENAYKFTEGKALVSVSAPGGVKYIFIDQKGVPIGDGHYDEAQSFSEGFAAVQLSGKWLYIDGSGKEAFAGAVFESAEPFTEDLAHVALGNRHGFIDEKGHLSIGAQFRSAKPFSDGLAPVQTDEGLWGYIDHQGLFRISPQFDSAGEFSSGLAPVRQAGESRKKGYGFIDKSGNLVIAPRFRDAHSFAEDLALVSVEDTYASDSPDLDGTAADPKRWGYINLAGDMVIPPHFLEADDFHNGVASATTALSAQAVYISREDKFVMEASDWPQRGSSGIVNTTVLVPLTLESVPSGAEVFLIPRFEWETHPKLESEEEKWWQYRVSEGSTPVTTHVSRSTYVILFRWTDKKNPVEHKLQKTMTAIRERGKNTVKAFLP